MKTYAAIKAEIAKLEKQAEKLRKTEVDGVIGRIKQAIAAYGLTAADLGLGASGKSGRNASRPAKPAARPKAGVAKYRDPATGNTWTGQGRPPAWIAAAADRDAFLIESATSGAGAARSARKPRAGAKRQPSAKTLRAAKRGRVGRKTAAAPVKSAAVQIESSAAAE